MVYSGVFPPTTPLFPFLLARASRSSGLGGFWRVTPPLQFRVSVKPFVIDAIGIWQRHSRKTNCITKGADWSVQLLCSVSVIFNSIREHYIILYYIILLYYIYYIILCFIILYYIILYYVILYYTPVIFRLVYMIYVYLSICGLYMCYIGFFFAHFLFGRTSHWEWPSSWARWCVIFVMRKPPFGESIVFFSGEWVP